jgi:hypothetical protein
LGKGRKKEKSLENAKIRRQNRKKEEKIWKKSK